MTGELKRETEAEGRLRGGRREGGSALFGLSSIRKKTEGMVS